MISDDWMASGLRISIMISEVGGEKRAAQSMDDCAPHDIPLRAKCADLQPAPARRVTPCG
ncbi:hypothetical protein WJ970_32070 [Achromobacter xylosoxidans]